jgi:hypothetical protein
MPNGTAGISAPYNCFAISWTVGNSSREGERMQKQYSKLLLRAFNGESDAAIGKVAWNNAVGEEGV